MRRGNTLGDFLPERPSNLQKVRGMPLADDERHDFRLVNLGVRDTFAVAVEGFLRFPVLVEEELCLVGSRVVDLEAGAAGLPAREPCGFLEQALHSLDVGAVLDREQNVHIQHRRLVSPIVRIWRELAGTTLYHMPPAGAKGPRRGH